MGRQNDGIADKLIYPGTLFQAPPYSIGCWFRPELEGDGAIGNLAGLCRLASTVGIATLRVRGDVAGSPLEAAFQDDVGSSYTARSGPVRWGEWQWGLGCFTTAGRSVFLDRATSSETTVATQPLTANRFSVANMDRGGSPVHFFRGAIAHLALWNAALTAAENAALASGTSPLLVLPSALIEYWPLGGRTGNDPELGVVRGLPLTVFGTTWAPDPLVAPVPPPPPLLAALPPAPAGAPRARAHYHRYRRMHP